VAAPALTVFSNTTGAGMGEVLALFRSGKTYCLLGSSGVGKTTLLNRLVGSDAFETQEVRTKDGKGRHTTARRQLIRAPPDNPVAYILF
jgi:ribosome biogenesis GTPase